MRTVEVKTSPAYEVRIGSGLLSQCGVHIAQVHAPCTAALVTDSKVDLFYAPGVIHSLEQAGFQVVKFVFPAGEQSKNLETYAALLAFLVEQELTRSDLIVALGGGVVGDLAGFAAATYLRGMDYVQLPTTLLAQVDSSVGGKTAVDLPQGKNMTGAFWQPRLVLCDTKCLVTLPSDVLADGLAEAVKYGMIADQELLRLLRENGIASDPEGIIARCVQIKADVVAADERDNGARQLLNFGHTAGHAMEKHSRFAITHGHAVAMGMMVVTRACVKRGLVSPEVQESLEDALAQNGLPVSCDLNADILALEAVSDKKRRGDIITLILPKRLGECVLSHIPLSDLECFFRDGL